MAEQAEADSGFAERQKWIKSREELMAQIMPKPRTVRVLPKDDVIRRVIKHPRGNIAFPETGSVEWPFDRFTKRRIEDGTVYEEKATRSSDSAE
jgi:hypothetical protein